MQTITGPWNKDRCVGQRLAFSQNEVCRISRTLEDAGQLHDQCLFMMAVDSFLRCGDLLRLKVRDVCSTSGQVRSDFHYRQQKTGHNVHPVLTIKTQLVCETWIRQSGKKPDDHLFTRSKEAVSKPISAAVYRRLVKQWAAGLGLDGEQYSTHSLRRSKPSWLYRQGVSVEDISQLLGHQSTECTLRYLGLSIAKAQSEARKHDIFTTGRGV